jgi:hypothetical protein
MQDEYGRPLSDDGQWVWDGSAWRPTGAVPGSGSTPTGNEPTRVGPPDYTRATQGQPGYGQQPPNRPGEPPPPTPWYKKPAVIIGALLVLSAVLATILVLTLGKDDNSTAPPSPSPTSASPTPPPTTESTAPPTTSPPTTTPPTTPPPTTPPPSTVSPGLYECTQGGEQFGSISFVGTSYTTSNGGFGTYQLDASTNRLTFTGQDLGDYTGTYNSSGPSMVLVSSGGVVLRCAQ